MMQYVLIYSGNLLISYCKKRGGGERESGLDSYTVGGFRIFPIFFLFFCLKELSNCLSTCSLEVHTTMSSKAKDTKNSKVVYHF